MKGFHSLNDVGGSETTSTAVDGEADDTNNQAVVLKAPPDMRHGAFIIFWMLGMGFLFPWNAFILAADYFQMLYPGSYIEFYFSVAYLYPTTICLFILVHLGPLIRLSLRICGGFAIFTIILLLVPFINLSNLFSVDAAFWLTVSLLAVVGIADAVVQSALYGFAGLFSPWHTQALVLGNAMAGVLVSILRIITKFALPNTLDGLRTSALVFFICTSTAMFVCILLYAVLIRLPIGRYHMALRTLFKTSRNHYTITFVDENNDTNVDASSMIEMREPIHTTSTNIIVPEIASEGDFSVNGPLGRSSSSLNTADIRLSATLPASGLMAHYLAIFRQLWSYALSVFLVFFVTLAVFPGVVVAIVSTDFGLESWMPVLLATLFNVTDFLGRVLPYWPPLGRKLPGGVRWSLTLLRIAFIPLLILCVKPRVFVHDGWAVMFVILFGLSNGYLAGVNMMTAPSVVPAKEREVASTMMVFFLVGGLTVGGTGGFLLTLWL